MITSSDGIILIQRFESCRLQAYLDSANIPTIGWGTIVYPTGVRVRLGESCTPYEADAYFRHDLHRFEASVDALTTDTVTQYQVDALVSFTYNEGEGAYRKSGLRSKVNANPNDPTVRDEYMKWYFAGGKPVRGLWARRHTEADHHFGVATPEPAFPG